MLRKQHVYYRIWIDGRGNLRMQVSEGLLESLVVHFVDLRAKIRTTVLLVVIFARDAMPKRRLCRHAVSVCLSIRPSVTFVHSVETNRPKHIFKFFSPSASYNNTILVFPYQTSRQYSDGNSPNSGVECRWDRQKSRFSTSVFVPRYAMQVRLSVCLSVTLVNSVEMNRSLLNVFTMG